MIFDTISAVLALYCSVHHNFPHIAEQLHMGISQTWWRETFFRFGSEIIIFIFIFIFILWLITNCPMDWYQTFVWGLRTTALVGFPLDNLLFCFVCFNNCCLNDWFSDKNTVTLIQVYTFFKKHLAMSLFILPNPIRKVINNHKHNCQFSTAMLHLGVAFCVSDFGQNNSVRSC